VLDISVIDPLKTTKQHRVKQNNLRLRETTMLTRISSWLAKNWQKSPVEESLTVWEGWISEISGAEEEEVARRPLEPCPNQDFHFRIRSLGLLI
jgi:hypothetical protein